MTMWRISVQECYYLIRQQNQGIWILLLCLVQVHYPMVTCYCHIATFLIIGYQAFLCYQKYVTNFPTLNIPAVIKNWNVHESWSISFNILEHAFLIKTKQLNQFFFSWVAITAGMMMMVDLYVTPKMVQKAIGVCLLFCYMSICIDGRNLFWTIVLWIYVLMERCLCDVKLKKETKKFVSFCKCLHKNMMSLNQPSLSL